MRISRYWLPAHTIVSWELLRACLARSCSRLPPYQPRHLVLKLILGGMSCLFPLPQRILQELGQPSDFVSQQDVALMCKNAANIRVVRSNSLEEEYKGANSADWSWVLLVPAFRLIFTYVCSADGILTHIFRCCVCVLSGTGHARGVTTQPLRADPRCRPIPVPPAILSTRCHCHSLSAISSAHMIFRDPLCLHT